MSSISNLSATEKGELMDQVKMQIAVANAQVLVTKMTEKCFNKCINKPGTSLDSSEQKMTEKCFNKCINKPGTSLDSTEQKCISMCMDRFMDSWNLVSRTFGNRLKHRENRI